jgi:hypothetical protein
MRLLLIVVAIVFANTLSSASAVVVVSDDIGGKMEDYTSRFQQLRRSGESVVIDGRCLSACTMLLGLLPADRVCATQNAILGFHAAWMYDTAGNRIASPAGTKSLLRTYPSALRTWISRSGGLRPEMMYLKGRALSAIVRPCGEAARRHRRALWRVHNWLEDGPTAALFRKLV